MNFIECAVKMIQLCDENDYERLDEFLIEAEKFFLGRLEYEKLIRLYISLHERIQSKGNIDKLIEYLDRFISLYENFELKVYKNHYYSSTAFLAHIRGNEEEVLVQLNHAFKENENENNIVAKIAILNNLAYTYYILEQYDESFSLSEQSEKLIKEYQLQGIYLHYKNGINLAKLYIVKNELNKAKEYLDMIIEFDEFKSSVIERIDYYATFAEYEANSGMITEAINHYKIAIQHAEENNMLIELRTYYLGFSKILMSNKMYEEYKIYKDKYDHLLVDINNKNIQYIEKKSLVTLFKFPKCSFVSIRKFKQKVTQDHSHIDELTEVYNSDYMKTFISKIRVSKFSKKEMQGIYIKLDHLKPILEEHGQIYTEKMVYEFSKYVRNHFGKNSIGRIQFNEFLIVLNAVREEEVKKEIDTFCRQLSKEKINLQKRSYTYQIIGSCIDIRKYLVDSKQKRIDSDEFYRLLREKASESFC